MKDIISTILDTYLNKFPKEKERQLKLIQYLDNHNEEEINDWNNFDGHAVAGGFIYAIKEKKILLLHHKDLDMFVYPGGHIDKTDKTPLEAVKWLEEQDTQEK